MCLEQCCQRTKRRGHGRKHTKCAVKVERRSHENRYHWREQFNLPAEDVQVPSTSLALLRVTLVPSNARVTRPIRNPDFGKHPPIHHEKHTLCLKTVDKPHCEDWRSTLTRDVADAESQTRNFRPRRKQQAASRAASVNRFPSGFLLAEPI